MTQPSDPQATKATTSPTTSALRLRFRGGQHHGKVVRVSSAKCTIGSAENATLRLSCPGVHPIHCLILRGETGTVARCMSPDTLVNDQEFEDTRLQEGDVLSIGPIEFEVLNDIAETPAGELGTGQQDLEAQRAQLEEQRRESEAQRAELEEQKTQLQDQQQQWRDTHDAEEARLKDWASQLGEFEQSLNAVQANDPDQTSQQFKEQLESLESTNQQLVGRLEELQAKFDAETSQWQEEKTAHQSELGLLTQQVSQQETLKSQLGDFEKTGDQQQELQQEVEQLKQELEAKQALQSDYDESVRELESMRQQMDQAEEYCNKWEEQQKQMESDLQTALMASDEKEHELAALRAKLAGKEVPEQFSSASQPAAEATYEQQPAYEPAAEQPAYEQQQSEPNYAAAEATPEAPQEPSQVQNIAPTQTMTMEELASFEEQPAAEPLIELGSETMIYDDQDDGLAAQPTSQASAMDMLSQLRDNVSPEPQQDAAPYDQQPADQAAFNDEYAQAAGAQSPEEVTYSQPESGAPIDTAAILAQYGHSVEEAPNEVPPSSLEVEPTISMQDPEPPAAAPDGEGEDDIQDYMAQLMKRVSSDSPGGEAGAAATPPVSAPQKKPQAPAVSPTIPVETQTKSEPAEPAQPVLDPSEFVPRAVAPEATGGLKALRAVANTSTRSALDSHAKRRLDSKALVSFVVGLIGLVVCLATGYLSLKSGRLLSLTMLTCVVSGFLSFLAFIQALAFSARKYGQSRRQQNLKQLSAR